MTTDTDQGLKLAQIAIECLMSYKNSDIRLTNVHMNPKGQTIATVLGMLELDSQKMQRAWSATNGRAQFNVGRSAYDGSAMQCTITVDPCDKSSPPRTRASKIIESALLLTGFALFHARWRPWPLW